jgi:hypothetical protein
MDPVDILAENSQPKKIGGLSFLQNLKGILTNFFGFWNINTVYMFDKKLRILTDNVFTYILTLNLQVFFFVELPNKLNPKMSIFGFADATYNYR